MKDEKLLKLLRLMMKNSRLSDRELAKRMGSSQPTVTRTRAKLEADRYIRSYTVVPDFEKLGYKIMAFTFSKMASYPSREDAVEVMKQASRWVTERPNVIFASDGQGLGGKDVVMISLHKDYDDYTDFMRTYALDWGQIVASFENFMVSIGSKFKMKSLDLKYLADES